MPRVDMQLLGVPNFSVGSSVAATTASGTDVALTTMTLTPPSGTYLCIFNGWVTSNNFNMIMTFSLYIDAAQQTGTVRQVQPFDGGSLGATSARGIISTFAILTVDGTQAINVRWHTAAGTATCTDRTLILLRVGG